MKKSTFEQMGGTYRQEGDYLLPNLTVPESAPVGIWGQQRKRYLREHRGTRDTALLLDGKLDAHVMEVDQQAQETFSRLMSRWQSKRKSLKCSKKKIKWSGSEE